MRGGVCVVLTSDSDTAGVNGGCEMGERGRGEGGRVVGSPHHKVWSKVVRKVGREGVGRIRRERVRWVSGEWQS